MGYSAERALCICKRAKELMKEKKVRAIDVGIKMGYKPSKTNSGGYDCAGLRGFLSGKRKHYTYRQFIRLARAIGVTMEELLEPPTVVEEVPKVSCEEELPQGVKFEDQYPQFDFTPIAEEPSKPIVEDLTEPVEMVEATKEDDVISFNKLLSGEYTQDQLEPIRKLINDKIEALKSFAAVIDTFGGAQIGR